MNRKILSEIVLLTLLLKGFRIKQNPWTRCFWCERLYHRKRERRFLTKDHVVPRYLGGKRTVPCCQTCNKERNVISGLALSVDQAKKIKSKERKQKLVAKYRLLVETKLTGNEQMICLQEINKGHSLLEKFK